MRSLLVLLAIALVPARDAAACKSFGHGCDPLSLDESARLAIRVVAGTLQSIDKHQRCVIAVSERWKGEPVSTVEQPECWRWKVGAKVIALQFRPDVTSKRAPRDIVADSPANRATLDRLLGPPKAP